MSMSFRQPAIGRSGLERIIADLREENRRLREASGDTGWVNAPLLNNWFHYANPANTGNGWGGLQYRRKNGVVYQRGLIAKSLGTTDETVYVIPAGFRPGAAMMFEVHCAGPNSCRLEVTPGGSILFPELVPNAAYVSMAANWIAEQ